LNVCNAGLWTGVADTAGGGTGCCLGGIGVEFCRALFCTGLYEELGVATIGGVGVVSTDLDCGTDFTEAGEARGLRLLLFVFGFTFFF